MSIHPKTGGAGLGAATGVLLSAVLTGAGVTVSATLASAIAGFISALGAFLVPAPSSESSG